MAKYEIVFRDKVEADSIESVYDDFLEYLADCVRCGDVSSFQFYELKGVTDARVSRCYDCGYEWSACLGDDELPDRCECGGKVIMEINDE